ncbi:MAG: hypothetical protein LC126_00225 [Bryobacterales bacterium]|nr:hypothetical protein [Bryobacterales bacterium]
MECRICETRKPRRYCPGVGGDICSQCCGTEREVSIDCPLDCEYLLEARKHEKFTEVDPKLIPNRDIRVTDEFMNEHDAFLDFLARTLLTATLNTAGANDNDLREALETMIRTYRTRQTGLIYESRPSNPVAGMIQQQALEEIGQFQEAEARQTGVHSLRNTDVLGVLVFLQRIAVHWDNKRPRGRSLISFLLERYPQPRPSPVAPQSPSLIIP